MGLRRVEGPQAKSMRRKLHCTKAHPLVTGIISNCEKQMLWSFLQLGNHDPRPQLQKTRQQMAAQAAQC